MTDNSTNDELNALPYNSSSPDFSNFSRATQTKAQDEQDLPALKRVFATIKARKQFYESVNAIALGEITVENQLIINKRVISLINELESIIIDTVTKVEEIQNGRK